MLFLQFLINGLLTGGLYSLIALSIVLIYKSTRVFNFAIGEMLTLGAFMLYTFWAFFSLPIWISLPLTFAAALALGYLIERLALRPLIGQPILAAIMVTLALSLVINGIIFFVWGSSTTNYPERVLPSGSTLIGPIFLSNELICTFLISITLFVLMTLFFRHTRIGLFMRATAEGHDAAQASGINVERIFAITWAISAMIAAFCGIMIGNRTGIGIATLPMVTLKAFPAVLFGGLESIGGAIIGGLTVGVIESLIGGLIDPKFSEITPYVILLLILLVRPEGLFGLKRVERI